MNARYLALAIALAIVIPAFPQDNTTPLDWGALFHAIDVTAWQGHRFKVTAAVRTECMDAQAGAEIWVRIDKSDKTMGFFYNMMNHPIHETQWKVYTITGK